jgi:hypothetical protein
MKILVTALAISIATITTQTMAQQPLQASTTLNTVELNTIFDASQFENIQATELSNQEMKDTQGAWVNFALGGAVGFGTYAATNYYMNKPITWQGSLYSIGTGALTGGVGGALGKAAGGGIGAAAWKLNGVSANFGLGSYRNYRGW